VKVRGSNVFHASFGLGLRHNNSSHLIVINDRKRDSIVRMCENADGDRNKDHGETRHNNRNPPEFAYPEQPTAGDPTGDPTNATTTHHPAGTASSTTIDKPQRLPSAYRHASLLSRLFFTWTYPLLKQGLERPLTDADLPDIEDIDSSQTALAHFHKLWQRNDGSDGGEEELRHRRRPPSLRRAILWDFFTSVWYVQPLMLMAAAAKVVQAWALGRLITVFQVPEDNDGDKSTTATTTSTTTDGSSSSDGYLWAGVLVACALVILFAHHHLFFATWRKGMQIRIACLAAVYDKSLRLSHHYQGNSNVLNLASNDIERFLMAALFVNYLIWAPLEAIAVLLVGYQFLGMAFVAGFLLLLLVFIPLQFYLGSRFAHYRGQIAALTDRRVNFIGQAVRGARVMKLSGYEHQFIDRITALRAAEMRQVTRANALKCWNESLFFATNVVISLVIFVVHVNAGNALDEGDVFTVFTLINILQLEMTKHFSLAVMAVSECYVSIGRIQQFMEAPELPIDTTTVIGDQEQPTTTAPLLVHDASAAAGIVVKLDQVECRWNFQKPVINKTKPDNDMALPIALTDINLEIPKGALTAVIGPVGAGKSALLQAIVAELPVYSGTMTRHYTSLSYAAQDPWIMDGSVRENILMGLVYDETWYNTVIDSCSLRTDLDLFPFGDATLLGENGVQCSGGQRARIGLARAIYRDADLLVADDPLSAVDAKVGRHLFREAIMGLVVGRGKSVVMATHQHQHIHATRCVLIMNGRVQCEGSYAECVEASGGKLTSHNAADGDHKKEDVLNGRNEMAEIEPLTMTDKLEEQFAIDRADHKEINVESSVQLGTYLNYMRAMGGVWVGLFLFALFAVTQGSVLVTMVTIGKWAERSPDEQKDWRLMGIIIGMASSVLLFDLCRAFLSFWFTLKASKRLHNEMTKGKNEVSRCYSWPSDPSHDSISKRSCGPKSSSSTRILLVES
jgi:ATP-binding cassette, subfamily C (CFTR/MRP), member 4